MAIRRDKSSILSPKRRHKLQRATRRGLLIEQLEDRRVFASPQLVSINPNQGDIFNLAGGANVRNIAPRELTLRFDDGQILDPTTVNSTTIRITRAGLDNAFGQTNDVVVVPGYIGIGESPNEIVVRFAENLPDDLYRIDIVGAGTTPLRNAGGEAFNLGQNKQVPFELNLGAQVVAVVPQPVDNNNGVWTQRANQIDVYFNNDDLNPALAQNVNFYKLIFTNDTVENTDDVSHTPISAVYNATTDKVVLTFASDLHLLSTGSGTYRLRIGTNEAIPTAPTTTNVNSDPQATFTGALTIASNPNVILNQQILNASAYPLQFPGDPTEPGHRDVPLAESHLGGGADLDTNTSVIFYNFQPTIFGYVNSITEAQKQRAREIFEIYSYYLGVDFIESATQGITVGTTSLEAFGGVSGPGAVAGLGGGAGAIMDVTESWDDNYGGSWFRVAMHEIGHALGLGHAYDLPAGTIQGVGVGNEPIFPGLQDIVHGQYLYRTDSNDIDMYKFDVTTPGSLTAETFAERLAESSTLNTVLRLYRDVNGQRTLIAQNDDYYSEDSFLKLQLQPGTYYIGVSSTGNDDYDPTIANSGMGGTSRGNYQLRLNFRADVANTLADSTGVAFDGDLDGVAGGVYDFWMKVATPARTIFVDKAAPGLGTGTLASPFNNIQAALNAATPGTTVRLLGNRGADNNLLTTADTLPYLIGSDLNGNALADGRSLDVPQGVTVLVDAGAVFKMRRGSISVGSNSATINRSGGALQVLGTPTQSVIFTSFNDDTFSGDTNLSTTPAAAGNWGGIIFQNDIDRANQRFEYEQHGIFLNYVNHADIRYGGGSVSINGVEQVVAPIYLTEARPTVTFNTITSSADAAISADPNSFEETNFHAPFYQQAVRFTSDYDRVGPDIYGNVLTRKQSVTTGGVTTVTTHANSINGMFVRIATPGGGTLKKLTTQARFDDLDIVHVIAENLVIDGTPGGNRQDTLVPAVELVTLQGVSGGTLTAGEYDYRITYVDASGNETPPSNATSELTIGGGTGSIRLRNLPAATAGYVARRIYRSKDGGAYELVAQIVSSTTEYLDNGATAGGALNPSTLGIRARLDARLAIDPGVIVKMSAARIEAAIGATFIAEGTAALPVVITSINDDRYGAGGTFDQTGTNSPNTAARGDWGGIFLGPVSSGSIDHAILAYGGGTVRLAGTATGYNVIEVHQADARITNTIIENNANGLDPSGQAPSNRFGAGFNTSSTIFVRGAEPIIVNNIIRNNAGAAVSINVNALNSKLVVDHGRSTGAIERIENFKDNQGAMVRLNRLLNNGINGMVVRGETLQTEGVWDDTDITHVVTSTINIVNFHTFGGLRLESSQNESLVVKFFGPSAGITANGAPLDIDDRIGGILNIVGQPGRPVILTSLRDDTVGAGKKPDGSPQTDTNNDGAASAPAKGDWRSILIDQYAHDRNVDIVLESESPNSVSPGSNSTPATAQSLGGLAANETNSDENLRLGYVIHGYLNANNDVDVYSFTGFAGTEVWLDIDQTTFSLDTVLELVDADGVVLARSNDSYAESLVSGLPDQLIDNNLIGRRMRKSAQSNGMDYWSLNTKDAGMRLVLPGAVGTSNTYYVRVRSNGPLMTTSLESGQTSGMYELQVRIQELDEKPGSTVRFTNISYATNGIEVYGQPTHSQLTGETGEDLSSNDTLGTATNLGNILSTDRMAKSIAGSLGKQGLSGTLQLADIDFYRFQVSYEGTQQIAGVTGGSIFSTIFDIDYSDRAELGDLSLWLFDKDGRLVVSSLASNISDDRPRAGQNDDGNDLTRGTTGTFDPFIGSQVLPEGEYYIAVSASGNIPTALVNQPLVRLEPVNSVFRIAEDHIQNHGQNGGSSTAGTTQVGSLIDSTSAIPYFLGDVALYVMQETNMSNLATRVLTVNPFTGAVQTVVNADINDSRNSFLVDVGDFAMNPDGSIFTFSLGHDNGGFGRSDGNSGNYYQINTGNGVATFIGDDGIVTYESDGAATPAPVVSHAVGTPDPRIGWGVQFNAMTFYLDNNGNRHLYAIGNRGDSPFEGIGPINNGPTRKSNLMYEFNPTTGAAMWGQPATFGGAGTSHQTFGNFDHDPANPTATNRLQSPTEWITGMTQMPGNSAGQGGLIYAVTNEGRLYSINQSLTGPGASLTYIASSADDLAGIRFSGLTVGPWQTEGGRYRQMLFATADNGRVYAFNTSGELQPVFANGATSIATGLTSLSGLSFGETETNLWGSTTNRGADTGHGINAAFDGSRAPAAGGLSYYFGDQTNNVFNYDLAGGAHGTLVTNEFSLKGYATSDGPVMYFNYYMQGDGGSDQFKVFVGGDDGNWQLLGTQTTSNGGWRQMRIPLTGVAGQEHLRLRFDFSTSGDMNVGDVFTTGEELRAVRGDQIQDGDTFRIGNITYEFNRGVTLVPNSGGGIVDGDTFTLTPAGGGASVTFEMDNTGGPLSNPANLRVTFNTSMSATQVATAIRTAILGAGFAAADVHLLNEELNITGLGAFVAPNFMPSKGNVGLNNVNNVPVNIHLQMTRDQVANVIDDVLEVTLVEQRLLFQAGNDYTDGQTFTLTNGTISVTFEFEDTALNDGVAAGNIAVPFSSASTARQVAAAAVLAFGTSALGTNRTARVDAWDLRRVALAKANAALPQLSIVTASTTAAVSFVSVGEGTPAGYAGASKHYKDLIRVIGHKVQDAGPLGFEETIAPDPEENPIDSFYVSRGVGVALAGDAASYPYYDPSMAGLPNLRVGFNSPTTGQNNVFEGFYLDDIIIGFAERGEMVTGAAVDTNFAFNKFAPPLTQAEIDAVRAAPDAVSFPYQLEIRSGQDYARGGRDPDAPDAVQFVRLLETYDTNVRMVAGYQLFAQKGSEIFDGQSFQITDGINIVRFEFDDLASPTRVTAGSFAIPFVATMTDYEVAQQIRNAINSAAVKSLLPNVTASTADGELNTAVGTDWWVNVTGATTITTAIATVPADGTTIGTIAGANRQLKGDTNRVRDQGQIILSGNVITNSSQYGIVLDAGQRVAAEGNAPHQGVVRNLRSVNFERVIPGVVAMNNIVALSGTGGIHISGDANTSGALAPVPFARIVNNTIYGGGVGTGIAIDQNASPTLMNNIVANLATGVSVDGSSTTSILTGMLYQGNTTDVVGTSKGSFQLTLLPTDPLFVNASAGNFYLAALSKAIDSSVDSLSDRNNYLNYKAQVGLGASPILAPSRDVTGQLRQDDPLVEPQGGVGQNVFKDRGAVDRVDVEGPTAVVTTPPDNDANGLDQNPGIGDLEINGVNYSAFTIQLLDGVDPFQSQNGAGIDDTTIAPVTLPSGVVVEKIKVTRDGVLLTRGVHYTIQYDALNDIISIVPTTGVWELGRTYVITLDNTALTGIKDLAGNPIKPNRVDGSTRFTIRLGTDPTPPAPNGIDYGDAPDPTYPSLASSNGARHIIQTGIHLGAGVSAETNARPNDSDTSDDGVVFAGGNQLVIGRTSTVTVTASQAGILDAWVDFNRNGIWEANEKVFTQSLNAGANNLSLTVPAQAGAGTTYARFRFSTTGGLAPTGVALNGEVEDYAIGLVRNPWTNPGTSDKSRYDVNGDNKVTPQDVLLVINYLNANGSGTLPVPPVPGNSPPPYIDVDNDGSATPSDVLAVINYLNANGSGELVEEDLLTTRTFAEESSSFATDSIGDVGGSPAIGSPVEAASPQFLLDTQASISSPLSVTTAAASGFVVSTDAFAFFNPLVTTDVWSDYLADVDGDEDELDSLLEEVAYGDSADDYFTSLGA